jgi:hypothetical protein
LAHTVLNSRNDFFFEFRANGLRHTRTLLCSNIYHNIT